MTIDPQSSYYDAGGIETIDIIRAKLTPEQFEGFLLGNALKYLYRYAPKGRNERDFQKAACYLRILEEWRCEGKEEAAIEAGSPPSDRHCGRPNCAKCEAERAKNLQDTNWYRVFTEASGGLNPMITLPLSDFGNLFDSSTMATNRLQEIAELILKQLAEQRPIKVR